MLLRQRKLSQGIVGDIKEATEVLRDGEFHCIRVAKSQI
jgi:hypothetical protein